MFNSFNFKTLRSLFFFVYFVASLREAVKYYPSHKSLKDFLAIQGSSKRAKSDADGIWAAKIQTFLFFLLMQSVKYIFLL